MKSYNKILILTIVVFAFFNAVRFSVSKILTPAPPLNFFLVIIILTFFATIPLMIYSNYTKKIGQNYSMGLVVIALLSLILTSYFIAFAKEKNQEIEKIGYDGTTEKHTERQNLKETTMKHVNYIYLAFLFIAALLIPIIDNFYYKMKLKSKQLFKLVGVSLGIHVLLYIFMWVAIFLIAIIIFFTSWG